MVIMSEHMTIVSKFNIRVKRKHHDFTLYVYTVLQKCLLRNNNIRMIVMRLDCVRWAIPDGLKWYLSEFIIIYHENMCYIVAFNSHLKKHTIRCCLAFHDIYPGNIQRKGNFQNVISLWDFLQNDGNKQRL